ncbi:MAG: signal peptidase I [Oscillospiraceae bacterium]|nr:signal peptidase I [Oscillospiraceae bacterium]
MSKNNKAAQQEVKATSKGKVGNTIVNVILILAILLGIFCSFTAFVSKSGSGVPSFFGIRPFSIQTESMEPFFNKGDLIIDVAVKDPKELEVGDVITFWTVIQGERVLNSHRIVQIDDYENYLSFVTKGDNNTIEDSLTVHQAEIVGKYVAHIPGVGTVIDFLQTGTGFLIVIVIPCALFFIYQLIVFFKSLFAYQAEKVRLQYQAEMNQQRAQDSRDDTSAEPAKEEQNA